MAPSPLFLLGSIPLLILFIPRWIDPYSLWDPVTLNQTPDAAAGGRTTRWCNMGWWKETDSFAVANAALGKKLLDLAYDAGYQGGGRVLDIAHGAGESLLLHLSSANPSKHLSALASLSRDTALAKQLVSDQYPNLDNVDFYTSSAQFVAGRDRGHPLDPMRGYLGESKLSKYQHKQGYISDDDDDDLENELESLDSVRPEEEQKYNLIYILDAIYHFPPSLSSFLTSVYPSLSPGGVIAYTDILPPPSLPIWQRYLLSDLLSVPLVNLRRSSSFAVYEEELRKIGYEDIIIQDWSTGVWRGFAKNLQERGGLWKFVGRIVESAEKNGWKFVVVTAKKGAINIDEEL